MTLGQAYASTQDEKYAREFVAQLRSWLDALPIHISPHWVEGPCYESGRSPLSLDAGIRMAQSWWPAYDAFKDSAAFDVDSQVRMLRSFHDHAEYLLDPRGYHEESNWGAMEIAGLLHVAVMLPEFRRSSEWLRVGLDGWKHRVRPKFTPTAQIELTTGYHGVTLGNFLDVMELARRNEVEMSAGFVAGLEEEDVRVLRGTRHARRENAQSQRRRLGRSEPLDEARRGTLSRPSRL